MAGIERQTVGMPEKGRPNEKKKGGLLRLQA